MSSNGVPVWEFVSARLGDLLPWADNPKFSTKAQAIRLLEHWKSLGQFQTIAIGPLDPETSKAPVYDGHQRLSALLTVYGEDYQVKALQSNRVLSDDERRHVTMAAGLQAGQWDWQQLAAWPEAQLTEWGMDGAQLSAWNMDALNLREMILVNDKTPDFQPVGVDEQGRLDQFKPVTCPACGHVFSPQS